MPNCPKCNKPVYFAEKITSLGKDWHKPCLRCANEKCNKTLSAGSHAENCNAIFNRPIEISRWHTVLKTWHEGQPYCNQCHRSLFGPKGYGHGGTESHTFQATK